MSDEFDHNPDSNYSAFIPLLILAVGFLFWFGYQDYTLNKQRNIFKQQIDAAGQTIQAAQNWQGRYAAMLKDLNNTGAKDPNAAAILKDAVQEGVQSGLIHMQPNTNGTSNATPPADSASK
jgi:hypothetical protein